MKKQILMVGFVAFLLGTCLFTTSLVHLQTGLGTISGKVTDATGAAVAGAEVTVTNEATGVPRTVKTNESGEYNFSNLPPGPYRLKVETPGFSSYVVEKMVLNAGQIFVHNVVLQPGGSSEIVEVTADSAVVQTTSSTLRNTISSKQIKDLPTINGQRASTKISEKLRKGKKKLPGTVQDRVHEARPPMNTESYARIDENEFLAVKQHALSTFSIDVDTASYSNVRRFLTDGSLPPPDAVRIEEMVNYFPYDYPAPGPNQAFSANVEVAECPWAKDHRLVRIGLRGRDIEVAKHPASNLVFLLDVSGSMADSNKLPLVKESLRLLVEKLSEKDRVSIVIYAGASGMALRPTPGDRKDVILKAIEELRPGGSTNGAEGIQLAYDLAAENFLKGGNNRVILATDGDFNVGITSEGDLTRLIEKKAKSGIFLTVLGFGMGNYKDSTMEKLADKGDGNYAYIDRLQEARKVLVEQMSGTLLTIAKDVKIQIEFNPAQVTAYRLIGYENRKLADEDFNDDTKDAGEIGADHRVTALYEVVPVGVKIDFGKVDKLKYQKEKPLSRQAKANPELLTLKLRYKQPTGGKSQLLEIPVTDGGKTLAQVSQDFSFAASVAAFGMLLRDSKFAGSANMENLLTLAQAGKGEDAKGYRAEFVEMIKKAAPLMQEKAAKTVGGR